MKNSIWSLPFHICLLVSSIAIPINQIYSQYCNDCVQTESRYSCSGGKWYLKIKNVCDYNIDLMVAVCTAYEEVEIYGANDVKPSELLEVSDCNMTEKTYTCVARRATFLSRIQNKFNEVILKYAQLVNAYDHIDWDNNCNGTGELICSYCDGDGIMWSGDRCTHCSGEGTKKCIWCGGDGLKGY